MKSAIRLAIAAATLAFAAQASAHAQAKYLDDNESQFIKFVLQRDFEKANFYIGQGLVDPENLSTGKPLPYYLYGPGTISYTSCHIPSYSQSSDGDCNPDSYVTEYLLSGNFDLNAETENGRRPISYVCWGTDIGFMTTQKLVVEEGVDVNFYDDYGFTPLHHCAWRGAHRHREQSLEKYLNIMATLIAYGTDVDAPLKIERTLGPHKEKPINPGATPLMLALSTWGGDREEMVGIKLLIALGADTKAKDDTGASLMNYVSYPSSSRHYEPTLKLLTMLHNNGADIMEPRGKDKKTFFETAMAKGDVDFAMQIMALTQDQ